MPQPVQVAIKRVGLYDFAQGESMVRYIYCRLEIQGILTFVVCVEKDQSGKENGKGVKYVREESSMCDVGIKG